MVADRELFDRPQGNLLCSTDIGGDPGDIHACQDGEDLGSDVG